MRRLVTCSLTIAVIAAPAAAANTSHEGWPEITGMLLMNKTDSSRPLDARHGHDPFDSTDPSYSCDAVHKRGSCQSFMVPCGAADASAGRCRPGGLMVTHRSVHNELLGGHGNDVIHAGPSGDVIWGDHESSGQPTSQVDHLYGGRGNDFIYAGHGRNRIVTGRGRDRIHAHFGRGEIHCGSRRASVYISHRSRPRHKLVGCSHISYRTVGY